MLICRERANDVRFSIPHIDASIGQSLAAKILDDAVDVLRFRSGVSPLSESRAGKETEEQNKCKFGDSDPFLVLQKWVTVPEFATASE